MAETEHNQQARKGLPRKEWFTLGEVARRWSKATSETVTEKDVLHYGIHHGLDLCCKPGDLVMSLKFSNTPGCDKEFEGQRIAVTGVTALLGLPITSLMDVYDKGAWEGYWRGHLSSVYGECLWPVPELEQGWIDFPFVLRDTWFVDAAIRDAEMLRFRVTMDDVFLPRIALERFEREHGLNPEPPADQPLIDKALIGEFMSRPLPLTRTKADIKPFMDPDKTKTERMILAIEHAAREIGLEPTDIPDGDKGRLKQVCEADYPGLFDAETSFENAWKAAPRDRLRMRNHASFAKRGR